LHDTFYFGPPTPWAGRLREDAAMRKSLWAAAAALGIAGGAVAADFSQVDKDKTGL
jgi:hypothetical protein